MYLRSLYCTYFLILCVYKKKNKPKLGVSFSIICDDIISVRPSNGVGRQVPITIGIGTIYKVHLQRDEQFKQFKIICVHNNAKRYDAHT